MEIKPIKRIETKNLDLCSQQNQIDIYTLELAALELTKVNNNRRVKSLIIETFSHTLGIGNGIYAIILASHNNKTTALIYTFLMIFWAKMGFFNNDAKHIATQEFYESIDLYNRLTEILSTTTPAQISDIAKIYRKNIPNLDNITPDDIKALLRRIMIKYER